MVSNVLIDFFWLQGTDSLQFPQVMAFCFKNECAKEETGVSATLQAETVTHLGTRKKNLEANVISK